MVLSYLSTQEVFARKATGLLRPFSATDAFIMSMGFVNIGSGAFLVYSSSLAFAPGFNLGLSFLIATIMNLFIVVVYSQMTIAMPRSGGDYVFVSRNLSPIIGFGNNFFFTVVAVLGIAWNSYFMGTIAVSGAAAAAGYSLNNASLIWLSAQAGTPLVAFAIGGVVMLFTAVMNIVQLKWLKRVNRVTFVVAMAAALAWIVVLATTPHQVFVDSFNRFAQSFTNSADSYGLMTSTAQKSGFSIPTDWSTILQATLISLPLTFFTLSGANTINFFAGEIKDVNKSAIAATIGALGVIALIDTILGYLLFNVVDYKWLASISYVAFNQPGAYTLPSLPTLPLLVSLANPNPVLVWLTFFGVIFWGYLIIVAYYLIATRNIFAWSYDGLLPTSMADVNPKTRTPIKSVVAITILSLIALGIYSFTPAFSYTNYTTAYNSVWIVPCLAAAAFPFVKKDLFEAQPSFVRAKIVGLPLMTLVGVLGAISVIYIDYVVVLNPGYAGIASSLATLSLIIILGIYILGLLLFVGLKRFQKSRGIDLDLVFKEIPPT